VGLPVSPLVVMPRNRDEVSYIGMRLPPNPAAPVGQMRI
jgi:hypothetical protein